MNKPSPPSERKSTTEPRERVETGRQALVENAEPAGSSLNVSATRPEPRPPPPEQPQRPPDRPEPSVPDRAGKEIRD